MNRLIFRHLPPQLQQNNKQAMKFTVAPLALLSTATAFQHAVRPSTRTNSDLTRRYIMAGVESAAERAASVVYPPGNEDFDKMVKKSFPGAISNRDLVNKVVDAVDSKGFTPANTLLATSFCADELARVLEDEFNTIYGHNFNLGGLSGFPFAGNTGFGAMSGHIPDDGYCLLVHAPHVGISKDGVIGKVERSGIALVDNCCGSAIAASNYLKGITDGGAKITPKLQQFSDFQQGAVQELILPFELDFGDKIKVTVPQLGDKKQILELSQRNAKYQRLEQLKQIQIVHFLE